MVFNLVLKDYVSCFWDELGFAVSVSFFFCIELENTFFFCFLNLIHLWPH